MLNHILCSLTKEEVNSNKELEYIRILGFSKDGQNYLNNIKKNINIPTRPHLIYISPTQCFPNVALTSSK